MKIVNCKKCNRCGIMYDNSPFACMTAFGERADSKVEIYGNRYNLCPQCTNKLYMFLKRK